MGSYMQAHHGERCLSAKTKAENIMENGLPVQSASAQRPRERAFNLKKKPVSNSAMACSGIQQILSNGHCGV